MAYKTAVKVAGEDEGLTTAIRSIADDGVLDSTHGVVVNNLNTMNRILIQMYPEFK